MLKGKVNKRILALKAILSDINLLITKYKLVKFNKSKIFERIKALISIFLMGALTIDIKRG